MNIKKNLRSIYGIHPLIEAIQSGKVIDKIFIEKKFHGIYYKKIIELTKIHNIILHRVPVEKLNRLTKKNHQGVFAFISPIDFSCIDNLVPLIYKKGKMPLLLILDHITDVRNFGSILRTAVCNEVDAVIIPIKNTALITSDTIKTSSGAIFKIPICKEKDLKRTFNFLKSSGIRILTATEKSKHYIYNENLTIPIAIVLGNENNGLSLESISASDQDIKIPICQNIESLNVSVACGIILYEVFKQRLI